VDATIERIAAYARALQFDALPQQAVHETKRRVIESLGCTLGGYDDEPCRIARAIAARVKSDTGARILGASHRTLPDGYTLIMTSSALTINPNLYRKLSYDPVNDFAPSSLATNVPYILAAHPSLGANTFQDFISIARARKVPISYGSAGSGNSTYLSMELLKIVAKTDIVQTALPSQ